MPVIETEIYPALERIEKYIDAIRKSNKNLQAAAVLQNKKEEQRICAQMSLLVNEINKEVTLLKTKKIEDESINRVVDEKLTKMLNEMMSRL